MGREADVPSDKHSFPYMRYFTTPILHTYWVTRPSMAVKYCCKINRDNYSPVVVYKDLLYSLPLYSHFPPFILCLSLCPILSHFLSHLLL